MEIVYRPSGANRKALTDQEVAEAVANVRALKIRRPTKPGTAYMFDTLDVVSVTVIGDVALIEVAQ